MTQAAEGLQSSIRAQTGTANSRAEDWHSLFDLEGIASGSFNERQLAWLNQRLGTAHRTLADARHAFALSQGKTQWGELNEILPVDTRVSLNFASESFAVHDGSMLVGYAIDTIPGSSFSRNSAASGFVVQGPNVILREFANNEQRLVVEPLTAAKLGFLSEQASTRISKYPIAPFNSWSLNFAGTLTQTKQVMFPGFPEAAVITSAGQLWHRANSGAGGIVESGLPIRGSFIYAAGTSAKVYIIIAGSSSSAVAGTIGSVAVDHQGGGLITGLEEVAVGSGVNSLTFTWTPNFTGTINLGVGAFSSVSGETVVLVGGWLETASIATTPVLQDLAATNVTRARDVWSIAGLGGSFPAGVALHALVDFLAPPSDGLNKYAFCLSDGTHLQRVEVRRLNTGAMAFVVVDQGAERCRITWNAESGSRQRVAVSAQNNSFAAYVNGVQVGTSLTGTTPSQALSELAVGCYVDGTGQLDQAIRVLQLGVGAKDQAWGQAVTS